MRRAGGIAMVLLSALCGAPVGAEDADIAYGEYLATQCVTCHRGDVGTGAIPAIVGLPADYFAHAMRDYRSGARRNEVMRTVSQALGDAEIASLAAYFGSLDPP